MYYDYCYVSICKVSLYHITGSYQCISFQMGLFEIKLSISQAMQRERYIYDKYHPMREVPSTAVYYHFPYCLMAINVAVCPILRQHISDSIPLFTRMIFPSQYISVYTYLYVYIVRCSNVKCQSFAKCQVYSSVIHLFIYVNHHF